MRLSPKDVNRITIVRRGEVHIGRQGVFEANISSCTVVCLFYPPDKLGAMCHIFGSREYHNSPSGQYIRDISEGYFYADNAIHKMTEELKKQNPDILNNKLQLVLTGGLDFNGTVKETLAELGLKLIRPTGENKSAYFLRTEHNSKYGFRLREYCVGGGFHRGVIFDLDAGEIRIKRYIPGETSEEEIIVHL